MDDKVTIPRIVHKQKSPSPLLQMRSTTSVSKTTSLTKSGRGTTITPAKSSSVLREGLDFSLVEHRSHLTKSTQINTGISGLDNVFQSNISTIKKPKRVDKQK